MPIHTIIMSIKRQPLEYRRVMVNVPLGLLDAFDEVCNKKSYARVEAIKESMRRFIEDSHPSDYESPEEQKVNFTNMWGTMLEAAALNAASQEAQQTAQTSKHSKRK